MPIIAVSNQKGGVGKTTSTLNLGAALQAAGKRVLLVDLDPQANLTVAAGILQPEAVGLTIGDLLTQAARAGGTGVSAHAAIIQSPSGLDIIPANSQLSAAELALVAAIGRESVLEGLLSPLLHEYEFILMDCLPSLSLLVVNAFTAAEGIIIPVQADYLAMQGLAQVMETVTAVQRRLNPQLQILGILMTMVDSRTNHSREVVQTIRTAFADQIRVFDAEIRLQVVLKDSVKAGVSIQEYDPKSAATKSYNALAAEVIGASQSLTRVSRLPAPAKVLPTLSPPTEGQVATLEAPVQAATTEKPSYLGTASGRLLEGQQRRRVARSEPSRFAEFLIGHDGWLGSGDQ